MKANYLRDDGQEVSFAVARAEISEPAPSIPTDAWMAQQGYKRIYDHKPELLANERYSDYLEEVGPERVDRFWNVTQAQPDAVYLAAVKEAAKAKLAEMRWVKETGGLDLGNGVVIKTDRESQAALGNAYNTLKNGLRQSIRWKAAGGVWVNLTLVEVEPLASAVSNFVANCFDQEEQHGIAVDACTTPEAVESYLAGASF